MEKQSEVAVTRVLEAFLHAEYGSVPVGFVGRFHVTSGKPWDQFDTNMCLLSWLSDDELYREASLAHDYHVKFNARSTEEVDGGACTVALILGAVESILDHYHDGGIIMSFKHRHLLEYYLCLEQGEMFVTDEDV